MPTLSPRSQVANHLVRRYAARTLLRRLGAATIVVGISFAVARAFAAGAGGARPNTVPVQVSSERTAPPTTENPNTPAGGAAKAVGQQIPSAATVGAERASENTTGTAKSKEILAAWKAKHPERQWENSPAHTAKASPSPGGEQQQTYGNFTARDEALWETSYRQFVARGKEIFHSGKELGTTVAISCDMCHPDAANTHPETYPKYQVQLGRVAMLRDMINWCLQNPVRAKPFADEDERLKAIEAYIVSQRAGREMAPGKH